MRRNSSIRYQFIFVFFLLSMILPTRAFAGYAETVPQGLLLLDESFVMSWVSQRWNDNGKAAELLDPIERYDPGGGLQGILRPEPRAEVMLVVNTLQFGILDNLTFVLGIPVVVNSKVDPNLKWEPGIYQSQIGRKYSAEDFWSWAESMGQDKPQKWEGNAGVLSDIIMAMRFRWTHYIEWCNENDFQSALTVLGAIPTGQAQDPEEVVSIGTTMWDLNFQGDLAFHLGFDKKFEKALDGRLGIGFEVFYETFFTRTMTSPKGEKHPLLLTLAPYIGRDYEVKPGDFSGFSFEVVTTPVKGPVLDTWLSKNENAAKMLPPLWTISIQYNFIHLQQSEWTSDYPMWDYDQEDLWRPGYKNVLTFRTDLSLLRVGVPIQIYASYRSLKLIPGKNARAPDIMTVGLRLPIPLLGF